MVEAIKAPPLKKKRGKTQAEKIDELMDYIQQGGSLGLEIEKRLDDLPEKYSAMLITGQDKYDLLISNLVKAFVKKGIPGIFVTVNKSGKELKKMLEKNKVSCENILIVDAITKTTDPKEKTANISYVGSPQDLTEMEAQINEFIEKLPPGKRFFILDSVSTMLIYNADKTIEKFIHSLSEKLRSLGFKSVFTIMKETKPETLNVLSQFCDKTIKTSPQISP